MILLIMIATLSGTAVFLAYLLEFALASRRDPLAVHTRDAAMRRARRAAGIYVRRSVVTNVSESVDDRRTPVP